MFNCYQIIYAFVHKIDYQNYHVVHQNFTFNSCFLLILNLLPYLLILNFQKIPYRIHIILAFFYFILNFNLLEIFESMIILFLVLFLEQSLLFIQYLY
jgi:hypothetical protein